MEELESKFEGSPAALPSNLKQYIVKYFVKMFFNAKVPEIRLSGTLFFTMAEKGGFEPPRQLPGLKL